MADYNEKLHNNANPSTYENARYLRQFKTEAENKLWQALRNRKLMNYKFRRQHPFGYYVLDFYCHEIKLCIEADGSIHSEKDINEYDIERTNFLNKQAISVLRFSNESIINNLGIVLKKIEEVINKFREQDKRSFGK